jgi:hypothetical protein
MKARTKIWIGVGAFVMVNSAVDALGTSPSGQQPSVAHLREDACATDTEIARVQDDMRLAQHRGHGGEGEGGEGGERGAANLPPDLNFALRIAQLRGHLLVGDELVKQGQWAAALPHFLHPTEEIYDDIRGRLKEYNTPPFEAALKALAGTVKAKKGGEAYAKAWQAVENALAAADAGLKARQSEWAGFTMETALELLKSAAGEYEESVSRGRIRKSVEYQDARGFVWQAERMIDGVAPALERKDAEALKQVREALAELKKSFPSPLPPKTPVKDVGGVLGDVSRVELAAGRLM